MQCWPVNKCLFEVSGLHNTLTIYLDRQRLPTFRLILFVRFRFLGSSNHDEYFTTTQRIRIVHEILQKTEFGRRRKAHIGLDRLLEESIFTAAYPLHEVIWVRLACMSYLDVLPTYLTCGETASAMRTGMLRKMH